MLGRLVGPLLAAGVVALGPGSLRAAPLLLVAYLLAARTVERTSPAVRLLRVGRLALPVAVVGGATLATVVLLGVAGVACPPLRVLVTGAVILIGALRVAAALRERSGSLRVALLGTVEEAGELERAMAALGASAPRLVLVTDDLDRIDARLRDVDASLVVHTAAVPRDDVLHGVSVAMRDQRLELLDLPAFYERMLGIVPLRLVRPEWVVRHLQPPTYEGAALLRRAIDLSIALLLLPPVLLVMAIAAPLIRLDGGGPAIFRQRRVGLHGRPFTILKLRTMSTPGSDWTSAGDARVTTIGRLLRRTHLDEVPQLLNVLRGEMALVGPRPEQVAIVEQLERVLPYFGHRHSVKPGITGWAQVRCGYADSREGSALKLGADLYYVRHRTVRVDLAILLETFRTLVADRQYEDRTVVTSIALEGIQLGWVGAAPVRVDLEAVDLEVAEQAAS